VIFNFPIFPGLHSRRTKEEVFMFFPEPHELEPIIFGLNIDQLIHGAAGLLVLAFFIVLIFSLILFLCGIGSGSSDSISVNELDGNGN